MNGQHPRAEPRWRSSAPGGTGRRNRAGRIRTADLLTPSQARYQAALQPAKPSLDGRRSVVREAGSCRPPRAGNPVFPRPGRPLPRADRHAPRQAHSGPPSRAAAPEARPPRSPRSMAKPRALITTGQNAPGRRTPHHAGGEVRWSVTRIASIPLHVGLTSAKLGASSRRGPRSRWPWANPQASGRY